MNSLTLIRGLEMPHDKNKLKVEINDLVMLPCRITHINSQDEKACNVTLEALYSQESGYKPTIACAANQVFKHPPVSAAVEHLRSMLKLLDNIVDEEMIGHGVLRMSDVQNAKMWLAASDAQQG